MTKQIESTLLQFVQKVRLPPAVALLLIFFWFYGRYAHQLYFVMDDYIETAVNLAKPLPAVIADTFSGRVNWSGYRPVTYTVRAILSHAFQLDYPIGYYLYSLGLHFFNTWLLWRVAQQIFAHSGWAFLAALIFLLLPAHNEAVFYMSANANLTALCFALLTLLFVLLMQKRKQALGYGLCACLSYGLGVLAYEVLLPLPLFIWLMEWRLNGKVLQRKQIPLYAGLALVAVAVLALRYWAMGQNLMPARADYATSTDPLHIMRGYLIFFGQMVLLHTSAWLGQPLFQNRRDWLDPFALSSLLSVSFMLICLAGWYRVMQKQWSQLVSAPWFWLLWGIGWAFLFSLPFAMLSGRYPENRYVYIPSVGFAIAVTALLILLNNLTHSIRLRSALLSLPILLLAFYAYVNVSDASEWQRASRHTHTFLTQTQALVQTFPPESKVFQVGMPIVVGNAYVFTTNIALQFALGWVYNNSTLTAEDGTSALRAYLRADDFDLTKTYLLSYDAQKHQTYLPEWIEDCYNEMTCRLYPTAAFTLPEKPTVTKVLFSEGLHFLGHKLSWLYHLNHERTEPVLVTCWQLTSRPDADYTFYIHFTDPNGETTRSQADHQLVQAYPFAPTRVTTTGWPLNTPVCDLTYLAAAFAPPDGGEPAAVRGGIWIPDNGRHLTATIVEGYEFDQAGRIIFPVSPAMMP